VYHAPAAGAAADLAVDLTRDRLDLDPRRVEERSRRLD
jgi:hypothetical protein